MKLEKNKLLVAIDIDMVLADNRPRILGNLKEDGSIDKTHFFDAGSVMKDLPIEEGAEKLREIRKKYGLIFLSARPKIIESATLEWLKKYHFLEDGDMLKLVDTSEAKIAELLKLGRSLYLFIDDLMFNYQGIPKPQEHIIAALKEAGVPFVEFRQNWPEIMGRYFQKS